MEAPRPAARQDRGEPQNAVAGEAQDRRWPLVNGMGETFQRRRPAIHCRLPKSTRRRERSYINVGTHGGGRQEAAVIHQRRSYAESLNEGLYSFLEDMELVAQTEVEPDTANRRPHEL